MFRCTFLVTLCVALSYQSLTSNEVESTKDEVKKAFHEMMAVIDKALTSAQTALDKAMDKVKSKATELENKANGELDKLLEPLRAKLDDLIAKAKQLGIDTTKCQKYVDDFSNTPDKLVHDLVECINTQISKAQGYIDDALNQLKKIEQDLNNIDKDIDNCHGNVWKEVKCYAELLKKITQETKDAPVKIAKDVAETVALVEGIVPILEACFTQQLKNAGQDAAKDVADFAICAAIPTVRQVNEP